MTGRHYKVIYGLWCCLLALVVPLPPGLAQSTREPRPSGPSDSPFVIRFSDTSDIKNDLRIADSLVSRDPEAASALARTALKKSRHGRYKLGLAHALHTLGASYYFRGLHDSAIYYYEKSLRYVLQLNYRPALYRLYTNLGESYFYHGAYESAIVHFENALDILETDRLPDSTRKALITYGNLGLVWARLRAGEQALAVFEKARALAERTGNRSMQAPITARIASAMLIKKDYKKAEAYFLQALDIAEAQDQLHYQIEIANSLAHHYIAMNRLESAQLYSNKVLELLHEQGPSGHKYDRLNDRLHAEHNLGLIYLQKNQVQKAGPLLLKAFEEAQASGSRDLVLHMEPDLAAYFAATGNYKSAYAHMQHYARSRDTILEAQKDKVLSNWMKARMSEKDKALVAQQLRISQQQRRLQAKNFWIGGALIGAVLLAGGFIVFVRNHRNRQRLQQATIHRLEQEQEINQLKAQVRGEEQERNRLALELHDGIASQLWAIKLNVDSLQQQEQFNGKHRQSLRTIYQQLDDTTQEVRKTAHNLMPDLLLEEGLATALASLCDKIKKQTELEVDFLEFGTIPRMDEEIELSLYRMIQELIQNVLKHAGKATQLLVQLSCTESLLNITVEDNGSGFTGEAPTASKGLGLHHVERRVKALQGHMDLQSIPGKGTTIYLEFDIQHLL